MLGPWTERKNAKNFYCDEPTSLHDDGAKPQQPTQHNRTCLKHAQSSQRRMTATAPKFLQYLFPDRTPAFIIETASLKSCEQRANQKEPAGHHCTKFEQTRRQKASCHFFLPGTAFDKTPKSWNKQKAWTGRRTKIDRQTNKQTHKRRGTQTSPR